MGGGGGSRYKRKTHSAYTQPISDMPKEQTGSIFTDDFDCSNFSLSVRLQNVNSVIREVKSGEILRIALKREDSKLMVVAVNSEGEICGYVIDLSMAKLIKCLQKGIKFVAKVERIAGNVCDVHVRPSKS